MPSQKKDEKINKGQQENFNEVVFDGEIKESQEPFKETAKERETVDDENKRLKDQIEKMHLDNDLKAQVQTDATSAQPLEEQKKIKYLLALAQKKGVVYAVNVAKNMDDPYLLDKFHDLLIEKGYYKEFIK